MSKLIQIRYSDLTATTVQLPDHELELKPGILSLDPSKDIKEILIGEGVRKIGNAAFKDFENLETLRFPESLDEIGNGAFRHCMMLKHVTVPNGVRKFGIAVFEGCEGLENVTLSENLEEITTGTFIECKKLKNLTIPNGVRKIGMCAFNGCENLESLTLPDSLEELSECAFGDCKGLKRIFIKTKDREKRARIISLLPEALKSKVLSEELSERILDTEEQVLLDLAVVREEIPDYIRSAFESVSLPGTESELLDYQKSLLCIRYRDLCVRKLKDYLEVVKKEISPGYSHGLFEKPDAGQVRSLDDLIKRIEAEGSLEVSEEEFSRLNTETLRAIFKECNVRLPESAGREVAPVC